MIYLIDQKIILPFPPSANRYWRKYNNRMVISEEAAKFKKTVFNIFKSGNFSSYNDKPVQLILNFYRPRKVGDLDNYLKVTIDSLNKLFFVDDKQIKRLTAEMFDDKINPRVEILISEYFT